MTDMLEHDLNVIRGERGQAGIGLLEVVAAILIMSTTILAVVSAVIALQFSSEGHRKVVLSSIDATDVAEAIELMEYVPCAEASDYSAAISDIQPYIAEITAMDYLVARGASTAAFTPTRCTDAANDQGIQRLTVTVTAPGPRGGAEDLVFVKRNDTCVVGAPVPLGADC